MFQAIHDGQPDQALLAYQYLQMLPKIAEGDANKVWIVPSEIGQGARGSRLARSARSRASRTTADGPTQPRRLWAREPRGRRRRRESTSSLAAAPTRRSSRRSPRPRRRRARAVGRSRTPDADRPSPPPNPRPRRTDRCAADGARRHREPPARTGRDPAPEALAIFARGHRRRHDQHRRRVGDARSRSRPCSRSATRRCSPTSRTPSGSCPARCPARSATGASWPASGPADPARRRRRVLGGDHRRPAAARLPAIGVRGDRAGADRARLRAGGRPAVDLRGTSRRRRAGVRRTARWWYGPSSTWPGSTAATSAPPRASC